MDTAVAKTDSEIMIPFPEAVDLHLKLGVGACRLVIRPGDGADWVRGTYDDPGHGLPLRVTSDGGTLRITQDFWVNEFFGYRDRPALLELVLGKGKPYALTIETGASDCRLDLGGLPLTCLVIMHGADDMRLDFSAPNPQSLGKIQVGSGASHTELRNLANANVGEISVEGGAAGFALDFGGVLQRDTHVRVQTGLAGVEISIPRSTPARIVSNIVLGDTKVGAGFTKMGDAFVTPAALQGRVPALNIETNVALGSLALSVTEA